MSDLSNYLEQPPGWNRGIYDLESYEQYASIKALRSSELKKLRRSPAHYRAAILNPKAITPALERSFSKGKAFDVLILHGESAFQNLVTIEPDLNRNTKAYKGWKKANSDAQCILTETEKNNILQMQAAAFQKKRFSEIFNDAGFRHRVLIWQCSNTGLWCKAEIDFITDDGTLVDLKTTADAGFFFFSRNAARLGYLNQAAFYLEGIEHITGIRHDRFLFAAVETEPPFESHVFRASIEQIDRAREQNLENMQLLRSCLINNEWPGYPDQIMELESGHYIYDDYEAEGEANGF